MPGKAAVTVTLPVQTSSPAAAAAPHKSFPFVIKKIMDIPPPNILEEGDDGKTPTMPSPQNWSSAFRFVAAPCHSLVTKPFEMCNNNLV